MVCSSVDKAIYRCAAEFLNYGFHLSSFKRIKSLFQFLTILRRLPWQFEIIAFAAKDHFPNLTPPNNVTIRFMSYVKDEKDIIDAFLSDISVAYSSVVTMVEVLLKPIQAGQEKLANKFI